MQTIKIRVYVDGRVIEAEVPGPLSVDKRGAKTEKRVKPAKGRA